MIRVLLCVLFASIVLAGSVRAELPDKPEVADLLKIADQPHLGELESVELKVYPAIRRYSVSGEVFGPEGQHAKLESFIVNEKWVQRKYIVSQFTAPWDGKDWFLLITFDADLGIYRKWVFTKEEFKGYTIGTRVGQSRSIAYASILQEGVEGDQTVSHESHTDEESRWSEVGYKDGKLLYRMVCVAKEAPAD